MLWLCAITTPAFLSGAWLFRTQTVLAVPLVGAAILPLLVTCGMAILFAVKKPDKLQSEDYQLRHETLQLMAERSAMDPQVIGVLASTIRELPASRRPKTTRGLLFLSAI